MGLVANCLRRRNTAARSRSRTWPPIAPRRCRRRLVKHIRGDFRPSRQQVRLGHSTSSSERPDVTEARSDHCRECRGLEAGRSVSQKRGLCRRHLHLAQSRRGRDGAGCDPHLFAVEQFLADFSARAHPPGSTEVGLGQSEQPSFSPSQAGTMCFSAHRAECGWDTYQRDCTLRSCARPSRRARVPA